MKLNNRMIASLLVPMLLTACGGGGGSAPQNSGSDVENVVNPGAAPSAMAGNTTTYNAGEIAMLDGLGSSDPDGDPLRYTWTQTAGSNSVQLSDRHAAQPVFEVPNANDTLVFSLIVNDGYENSGSSTVVINTLSYTGSSVAPLMQSPFRGSYSLSDGGFNMVVTGTHLYRSAGINGLQIIDINDPANLNQSGSMTLEQAHHSTLIGNMLYHTSFDAVFDNLHVYVTDISNPASPSFIGQATGLTSSTIGRLASVANTLYVGTSAGLNVYLVGDTGNPVGTTIFTITQPLTTAVQDVVINGNYAYVAAGSGGLRIIDISNATMASPSISEVGSYVTTADASKLAVSGNYAYIATGTGGLVILDISNPALPSLVTTIPMPAGNTYGVRAVDVLSNTLYMATDFDVLIYDVSTPASPVLSGSYRAGNLIRDVRATGSYFYISDTQGLRAIPSSKVSPPRGTAIYTAPDTIRNMIIYGDLGFVRMDRRVDVLDMRNALAPTLMSSYTISGADIIFGMAIIDNFAYLSQGINSLKLLRFRNPAAASIAKTITVDTSPRMIIANDAYAYLYHNDFPSSKVAILDVNNPYSPAMRGSIVSPYNTANWLRSFALNGNYLYMTELNTNGTFRIADVSNATNPTFEGSGLGPVDLYGIAPHKNYVFTIGNNAGVKVIDVTTPDIPSFAGPGYSQDGYSISIAASRAYTGSDFVGGGFKILDISNPLSPNLSGEIAPSGGVDSTMIYGNTLYTTYNGTELHYMEREPILATRYTTENVGAALAYTVNWVDAANGQDRDVKCQVTGGSCVVGVIDQTQRSATITWTLPISAGDHEIMITVGNGHYFSSTKDRVMVQ